ncbi:MAG: hypothetical protein ACI9E1_001633 [Cryomorphaceae bacterium]|jgi:hypothetical protein
MNKIIKNSVVFLGLANFAGAAITLGGGAVSDMEDKDGNAVLVDRLYVVVLDAGRDGFGAILDQANISLHNPIDDGGNDIVLKIASTAVGGPLKIISQGSTTENYNADSLGLSPTDVANVRVYWFADLPGGTTVLNEGDAYGEAFAVDWFVDDPNDSPTLSNVDATGSGANTLFVQAVPEPTSLALLGLGAFGFIMRRSRG